MFGIPPLRRKAHFCHFLHLRRTATGRFLHYHRLPERASSTPSQTLRSPRTWPSWTPIWLRPCPEAGCPHTGMDATDPCRGNLCFPPHAEHTDPLAIFAIRMIRGDLVNATMAICQRDSMHNAQCLAGIWPSQRTAGHRALHSTQDRRCLCRLRRTHHPRCQRRMYLPKVIAFNAKDPGPRSATASSQTARWLGQRKR